MYSPYILTLGIHGSGGWMVRFQKILPTWAPSFISGDNSLHNTPKRPSVWVEKISAPKLGGGNSNMRYFHPYLGKWSNLTSIFQMGWNPRLEKVLWPVFDCGFFWSSNWSSTQPGGWSGSGSVGLVYYICLYIWYKNQSNVYGCFLKWWYPPKHTKIIIFSRKTPWLLGKPTTLGNPPKKV